MKAGLKIDGARLVSRLEQLGEIGALEGGGVCRLAFSKVDAEGRRRVTEWMEGLGLEIRVDGLGNTVGIWRTADGPPVMTGSHIDTVRTGGLYDGNLGVLAGLEVIQTLQEAGVRPARSLAVGFFTNEEGARFAPDMMGSLAFVGALPLNEALDTVGIDGRSVREELAAHGGAGPAECGGFDVHAFVELHIEQGPLLEEEGIAIGAVEGVQGISWTELTIVGISNHAGTTPMRLRTDAGYAAAAITTFVRELAWELGGDQVATVGLLEVKPNLVNVVPNRVRMTVDLRNTDDAILTEAEGRLAVFLETLQANEGVKITGRPLARFAPVRFDPNVVDLVEATARAQGRTVRRMPSGAGHDAQMLQRICPAGMIFVPSVRGISHNIEEHTDPADLEAGANVLLHVLLALADT